MSTKKDTDHGKRIGKVMILPGLIVFSQFYLFQPLLPQLSKYFSVSLAASSLVVSATMYGLAIGLFVFAFYADVLFRKKLMLIGLSFSSIATILSAISWNLNLLVFFSLLKGVFFSGVLSVAVVYISEEVKKSSLGIIIGLFLTGNILGGMWGRVAAGLISDAYSWKMSVIIIGSIGLLLTILFGLFLPKSQNFHPNKIRIKQKFGQMKYFFGNPLFLKIFAVTILIMGVFVSVYNYISFRLETPPFSLPNNVISFIFLIYVTGILATIITGVLSHKFNIISLLKTLIFLFLAGAICLFVDALWVLVVGLSVLTFGLFGIQTIVNKIISVYAVDGKSTANCLYLICLYLGAGVIGSSTGIILDKWGWNVFMYALIGCVIISLVLISSISKTITIKQI